LWISLELFSFFGGTRVWIQDLTFPRQALCPLSYSDSSLEIFSKEMSMYPAKKMAVAVCRHCFTSTKRSIKAPAHLLQEAFPVNSTFFPFESSSMYACCF
jgi:hypothetical protein